MSVRTIVFLSMMLLAACGSVGVEGAEFGGPPRAARAFPQQTLEGIVYAEASYTDHATEFGVDLIEEVSVLPIRLQVLLRGTGAREAQILLNPSRMNLRLILSDGAALQPVEPDDFVSDLDEDVVTKLRAARLSGGLLGEQPKDGYVFFKIEPPNRFAMSGSVIRHGEAGIVHSLDVADSLLTFDLAIGGDGAKSPFYVGIRH